MKLQRTKFLLSLIMLLLPALVVAADFRSVSVPKAILYDAPSTQAKKLYLLGNGYPVEVIVNLTDWLKVRDNQGGISWVEAKQLSAKRTVLVVAPQTDFRQTADASGVLLAQLEKDVVVDLVEAPAGAWLKVKHRDGLVGFVQATNVWGY